MSELIILKTHRNEKYSIIHLKAIEDPRLSWKAKGIHTYLITRPPGWSVRLTDLLKKSICKRASLLTAISELKKNGYITITRSKDKRGRFTGTVWEVFEVPQTVGKSQPHPQSDFPTMENQTMDYIGINNYINNNQTTTTNNVVVVDFEKNNFPSKTHTLIEAVKGTGLEGFITEKAIRAALKSYKPEAHSTYQPETPMEGIKRILDWMKHIPVPQNPPGFLVRMAREGMDKPSAVVRAEQRAEAERLEREKRERERAKMREIEQERERMTDEERAEIKKLIASITK